MKITFLRHPPIVRPENLCGGRLDFDLADNWAEFVMAWDELDKSIPTKCSPLNRCATPGQFLFPEAQLEKSLLERGFGEWEGLTWDLVGDDEIEAWTKDPIHFKPPQGESFFEMRERILAFINEQKDLEQIWISHLGVYRVLMSLNKTEDDWSEAMQAQLDFGAVVLIEI